MYSYTMDGDRIIRHICGNPAGREAEWYFTSAWGADAKGRRSFWDSSREFCRPTAMSLNEKVGGPKLVHAGCWAHSRRKFFDAVKLNPNDAVATRIVKCFLLASFCQHGPSKRHFKSRSAARSIS